MPNGIVALNNYLQKHGALNSLSWKHTKSGLNHAPQWTSICKIDGEERGIGTGTHKHLAQDAAANMALGYLTGTVNDG